MVNQAPHQYVPPSRATHHDEALTHLALAMSPEVPHEDRALHASIANTHAALAAHAAIFDLLGVSSDLTETVIRRMPSTASQGAKSS